MQDQLSNVATYSTGASPRWSTSFLSRLSIVLATGVLSLGATAAGGPLVNGANHSGVIQIGGVDTWTLQAGRNDYIFASVAEVPPTGADPDFLPRLQLVAPDGATVGSAYGADSTTIGAQAPSSGTYTLRVYHFTGSGFQQKGPAAYTLTTAKTPGPYAISPGDEGGGDRKRLAPRHHPARRC